MEVQSRAAASTPRPRTGDGAGTTTTGDDTGAVRDAIRDGKVSREERTLFEHGANSELVDSEQDRLRQALRANQRPAEDSEASATAQRRDLQQRIADERSLVGALEAERTALESGAPDAADDYQQLRVEAQPWIDQFNENGGQYYQGDDLMGDDWDADEVDFDQLANRFSEHPDLLDDFTRVQGRHDESLGDDPQAHIDDVAEDDPEDAARIALRLEAATNLQGIMERYLVASAGVEAAEPRIDAIEDEQAALRESIGEETELLEQLPAPEPRPVVRPPRDIAEVEGQFPSNQPRPEPAPTPEPTPEPERPTPDSPPASEIAIIATGGGSAAAPASTEPTQSPVQVAPAAPAAPAAPVAPAPPTDAQLLDAATQAGILDPAARECFGFNDAGELTYAAQPGDGYWQAAEHVRPRDGQDFGAHWQAIWDQNSLRAHGSTGEDLVLVGQQVTFPGYDRDSLLAQLGG